MRAFISNDPRLFFKGSRKEDPRLADFGQPLHEDEIAEVRPGVILAGYPDDEGVRLNGGRVGAKEAPDEVRRFFYRSTFQNEQKILIYDLGNLQITGPLSGRHETAKAAAEKALSAGHRWVSIGGGHDYGYADVGAFLNDCKRRKKRGLILHFDAHLDCRPDDQGLNSGTPFYRILKNFDATSFDIVAIGLQKICNADEYLHWARQRKMKIYFAEEFKKAVTAVRKQIQRRRPVFISLDMDIFATAYAPGTSNNWPLGASPAEILPLFTELLKKSDVRGLGIYEVSPPLDVAQATSKLAAQFMFTFLNSIKSERLSAR